MPLHERPQSLLAPLRRDAWLYPLGLLAYAGIPALFGLYEDLGDLGTMLVLTCLLVPSTLVPAHLVYAHLWPRLVGERHPLSPRALAFHAVAIYGCVRLGGAVAYQAFRAAPEPFSSFPFEEWGDTGLYLGLGLMTVGAAVLITLQSHRTRLHDLEVRELRAVQAGLSAQLEALQARIQPHFLFNALNTLACMIEEEPRLAEKAVERLADLLRYTLGAASTPLVPLARELAATEHYLELEALRFGDRLKLALHVDPDVRDVPVPPLVLQPLVENAVLHGGAGEAVRIEVTARREGGSLVLCVDDDGPGPGASAHAGARTALRDLRARLALLRGEAASLEIGRGPLGGCRARIVLPLAPPDPGRDGAPELTPPGFPP